MAGAVAQLSEEHREILEQVCACNQAVEIHYHDDDEDFRTARARLVALLDDEIQITKAQSIGREVILRADTRLMIYFLYNGEILAFGTKVRKALMGMDLNQQKRIIGMALNLPRKIERQQRRQQFRISLAQHDVRVALHETVNGSYDQAPIDAIRFEARATNISASGLAILARAGVCPHLKVGQTHYAQFLLPGCQTHFRMPMQVRHVRRAHDGEDIAAGLRFLSPEDPFLRWQIRDVNRFVTDEQRRQIQAQHKTP